MISRLAPVSGWSPAPPTCVTFNGLGEQMQHVLDENPFSGHLFIFRGRRVIPSNSLGRCGMDCASSPNALRLVNFCRGTWLYLPDQCQYGVRLTLTDLQPGGINHQMRDFTPGERFETDINRLCALADTGVNPAAQRNIHQCKMESIKPRSAQGQPEYAFNDQNGGDGEIRIALRSSRDEGRC